METASLQCYCGKQFSQHNALSNHTRACPTTRKRVSSAISKARDAWQSRKRQRGEGKPAVSVNHNDSLELVPLQPSIIQHAVSPQNLDLPPSPQVTHHDADSTSYDDPDLDHLSLATRKPRREIRLPKRYRHDLPQPSAALPPPIPPISCVANSQDPGVPGPSLVLPTPVIEPPQPIKVRKTLKSPKNIFGLFRQYHAADFPSHDPEELVTLEDLCDRPNPNNDGENCGFGPYPNESSFLLGEWYWCGGVQKSKKSFAELVNIIGHPGFQPADIWDTKWDLIDRRLGGDVEGDSEDSAWVDEQDAGWMRTSVSISVPFHRGTPQPGPREFVVHDFYHRSVVSILRERVSCIDAAHFHFEPFELLWQPTPEGNPVRVHGELYASPAFLDAHEELQNSPPEPGCNLPRVVAALMFASDTTHLTSFGDAKLWPLYMHFGNDSKYRRGKPTLHLCNHVAYFQKLPDSFKDFATLYTGGKHPGSSFMAHCQRELLHAQWKVILDEEFVAAYVHGAVIQCFDGEKRRFFPRIFTYSADYPEKIILASIRNRGGCPCPLCLIPLEDAHKFGQARDRTRRTTLARVDDRSRRARVASARDVIYKHNHVIHGVAVERLLAEQSLVPTDNAFSSRLSPHGFDMFTMFVTDIMHEFELGTWRSLFIHLLRILECSDPRTINELDRRFRAIPTFGRDTIRKFSRNCSTMKQFAARDYEDILQCAIPVFEGLLPEPHNRRLMKLLYITADFHGFAKLRQHTDVTMELVDDGTTLLGNNLRDFVKHTCTAFETRELQREATARNRRQSKKCAANNNRDGVCSKETTKAKAPDRSAGSSASTSQGRQRKLFNLNTYKHHALGEIARTIRRFGTTDSYSTEPGELEHRTPKRNYLRTSKKKYIKQLTQIERRQSRIRRIRARLKAASGKSHTIQEWDASSDKPYHIGKSQNEPESIPLFLQRNAGDPAVKNFVPKLKSHLLSRLQPLAANSAGVDPSHVLLKNDRMYKHRILRINYTTYDVRRAQDVVNPGTPHNNIMLLADVDESEDADTQNSAYYLHARVLGIYHVNAIYVGPGMADYNPVRLEFLWVRWYRPHKANRHLNQKSTYELQQLAFPPVSDGDAFGFVDPAEVLRGCHILPRFAGEMRFPSSAIQADSGAGLSPCARDGRDWNSYYIGRFVDRDMLVRHHPGLGIGHTYAYRAKARSTEHQERSMSPVDEGDLDYNFEEANHLERTRRNVNDDHLEGELEDHENEDLGTDSEDSESPDGPEDLEWEVAEYEMYESEVL